jgi:hypothetical protein
MWQIHDLLITNHLDNLNIVMWQIHDLFINKSFKQPRHYNWLVKIEPTLSHGFTLDSLHSHNLDLKTLIPNKYIIDLILINTLKWFFVLRLPSGSFKIPKLLVLQLFGFIIFSYDYFMRRFQLKHSNFRQNLSNFMLHAFIKCHFLFFEFLCSRFKLLIWFPSFLLAIIPSSYIPMEDVSSLTIS